MASSFVRNNTNNSTATANNNSNDTNSIGTSSVRYVGDINETSDTDSLSTNNSAKMKEQMERNKAFLIEKKNQKLREQQEQSQNNEQQQHDSMMKQDPYQWHEFLRETEMVRRANIQSKLQYNQMYRESLQQLLQDSMNETQTAYRLTMGLALAQQQLSDTLLSGCNSDDNSASNSKLNYYSKNKQKSDNDNVEQPPMMAIAVPENNDNTPNNMSDAVSVLEKEHSLIQHKVSRSVHHQQHAAKRIQELYERSSKYSKKLNDRAKQILNELQEAEDNVQQTWDTYFNTASVLFLKSGSKQYKAARAAVDKANNVAPGAGTSPSNAMNNDMYTIGNVWLAELKYRSAVSRQMDDWVKNGSVLQFNFIMAKDAERQRRLRLRQYLHMTIQKQKSVFTSIEDAHKDALYDLWMNGPEDEYDNVNFDDDSNSITCMSSTNHSTESSSLFADIDKEMEMQLNEMMKQYNEHDTRAVLFDHPSLSKCPTMLYQKRLQLKEEKENMLRQKKKQEKQHQQKLLKDFTYENDDDSDNDSDNADDDKFNPKNIDSMLRTSGTIQERIQRISEMSGSTTFWNPLQQSQNDPNNNNSKQLLQGITASIASNMVDLSTAATSTLPSVNPTIPEKNQSMESSNNDDKTASSDGKKNDATATPSESNSTDVTTISKEVVSSSKSDKDENKTRSKRTKSKPVDPQKQVEEDMDRLLYSGALLESHYVQYAAVVEMKLEENDGSVMYTTGSNNTVYKARPGQKGQVCIVMPEDEAPKLCLAVVTTDETLHLFDLPEQVTEQQPHASLGGNDDKPNKPVNEKKSAISTSADSSPPKPYNQTLHLGSAAEDALQMILLHKQEHDKRYDKKLVEPESTKSPEISPKRNRLRLTKLQQQQSEEQQRDADVDDSSDFGLTPFLSMHLNEYTVRMTRRGEFALKITKNFSSYGNSSTASFNNNGSSINNNSSTIMTIGENSDAMIGDDNTKRQLKVRLKVSSRDDQLAIVSAARGQLTRMEV